MAKPVISPLARTDMREITEYLSRELRNADAARRLIRRLRQTIEPLGAFPEMGTPLHVRGKQRVPYRYLVCGSYMVFYHIADGTVMIDRVLYGRRDYLALLFGDQLDAEDE